MTVVMKSQEQVSSWTLLGDGFFARFTAIGISRRLCLRCGRRAGTWDRDQGRGSIRRMRTSGRRLAVSRVAVGARIVGLGGPGRRLCRVGDCCDTSLVPEVRVEASGAPYPGGRRGRVAGARGDVGRRPSPAALAASRDADARPGRDDRDPGGLLLNVDGIAAAEHHRCRTSRPASSVVPSPASMDEVLLDPTRSLASTHRGRYGRSDRSLGDGSAPRLARCQFRCG